MISLKKAKDLFIQEYRLQLKVVFGMAATQVEPMLMVVLANTFKSWSNKVKEMK